MEQETKMLERTKNNKKWRLKNVTSEEKAVRGERGQRRKMSESKKGLVVKRCAVSVAQSV
jgi:hypothetical protein